MWARHGHEGDPSPASRGYVWTCALLVCLAAVAAVAFVLQHARPPAVPEGLAWAEDALARPFLSPAETVAAANDRVGRAVAAQLLLTLVAAFAGLATLIADRTWAQRAEVRVRRSMGASRKRLRAARNREAARITAVAVGIGLVGAPLVLWIAEVPGVDGASSGIRALLLVLATTAAVAWGISRAAHLAIGTRVRGVDPRSVLARRRSVHDTGTLRVIALTAVMIVAMGTAALVARGIAASSDHWADLVIGQADLHEDPGLAERTSVASPGAHLGLGAEALVVTECGRCFAGGLPIPMLATRATHLYATQDTFRHLGVELLEGRLYRRGERTAVVDESLAARYFEGGRAVGKSVQSGPDRAWYPVVGVVSMRPRTPLPGSADQPSPTVYLPAEVYPGPWEAASPRGRDDLGEGVTGQRLLREEADRVLGPVRHAGWVLGLLALTICGAGVHAVVLVSRRSARRRLGELALRRAVGARAAVLHRMLFAESVRAGVIGAAVGVWGGTFLLDIVGDVLDVPLATGTAVLLAAGGLVWVVALLAVQPVLRHAASHPPARLLDLLDEGAHS